MMPNKSLVPASKISNIKWFFVLKDCQWWFFGFLLVQTSILIGKKFSSDAIFTFFFTHFLDKTIKKIIITLKSVVGTEPCKVRCVTVHSVMWRRSLRYCCSQCSSPVFSKISPHLLMFTHVFTMELHQHELHFFTHIHRCSANIAPTRPEAN